MEHDELAAYLDALQRENCYRVDEVLKESPFEVTQRVSFIGANGAQHGPYIRKLIKREAGLGSVYERLFSAQQEGRRFKYLPDVLECYARNDELVVVMEYAHGETLQDLVYGVDPSLELTCNVFPVLCDAVTELHEDFDPPIIHRDLKPSNVILSQGGCTIIDFGIAREFKDDATDDTSHFGTRSFAPPEQFGFGQTTVRSDVYALGMLLYFCLTEKIPDPNDRASWYRDQRIPKAMRGVIAKATAFDPKQRYASASDLKGAFAAALVESSSEETLDGSMRETASDGGAPYYRGEPPIWQTPAPTSFELPAQMQAPNQKGAPHIVGRVWNIIVIVSYAAFVIYAIYRMAYVTVLDTSMLGDNPLIAFARVGAVLVFLALVAFACLDKRRLRQRIPFLSNVKAWQIWVVALIAFVIITAVNRLFFL